MSSKPTTATSSGTRTPAAANARMTPMAIWSLAHTTASGSAPRCLASRSSPARSPLRTLKIPWMEPTSWHCGLPRSTYSRASRRWPALGEFGGGWLRPGLTEREVGAVITEAILAEGHATVDFVIVGSGPNAASPHHDVSDRVLAVGDVVVVDIGGTMPSGYCSDSTRTYAIGEPPAEFVAYYDVLYDAQEAACAAVRPGVTAESVDAAAREPITAAGYGEAFFHRTGHGIGLEAHEDPYIVAGNGEVLEPGMAFSVEPGIYPGPHGARIEDIVVCTADGYERLNNTRRELFVVG